MSGALGAAARLLHIGPQPSLEHLECSHQPSDTWRRSSFFESFLSLVPCRQTFLLIRRRTDATIDKDHLSATAHSTSALDATALATADH